MLNQGKGAYWRRLLLLFLLPLAVLGCGDSNSEQYVHTDSQGNVRVGRNQAVYADNVRLLTAEKGVDVVSIADNSITLSGNVPALAVNDIVLRAEDEPRFHRRVTGVTRNGNNTVITTGRVSLLEIYKEADIAEEVFLGPELLSQFKPGLPGVSFGEPTQLTVRSQELGPAEGFEEKDIGAFALPIHFEDARISDQARGSVVVNGDLMAVISVKSKYQVGLGVSTDIGIAPRVSLRGQLTARGEGSGDFRKDLSLCLAPAHIPLLTFFGIGANLEGDFIITIDGHIEAEGTAAFRGDGSNGTIASVEAGLRYVNNEWKFHNPGPQLTYTVDAPAFRANANLNLSLVQPKFGIDLLDMSDVSFRADVMRLEVEALAVSNPDPAFNVKVFRTSGLGIEATLEDIVLPVPFYGNITLIKGFTRYLPLLSGNREKVAEIGPPVPSVPPGGTLLAVLNGKTDSNGQAVFDGSAVPMRVGEQRVYVALTFVAPSFLPSFNYTTDWLSTNSSAVEVKGYNLFAIATAKGPGKANVVVSHRNGTNSEFVQEVSGGEPQLALVQDGTVMAKQLDAGTLRGQALAQQAQQEVTVSETGSKRLRAVGVYPNGQVVDLTYAVNWSAAGDHAEVYRNGQIDAHREGTSQLTVSLPGSSQSLTTTVNVVRPQIRSMHITPLLPTVAKTTAGRPLQLHSYAIFTDNSERDVTNTVGWFSSDADIASVRNGLVTPVRPGEVNIACIDPDGNAIEVKTVVIDDAPIASLSVEPKTLDDQAVGQTQQFHAIARFVDGSTRDITDSVIWSVSGAHVGRIDENGLYTVTGLGEGRVKAYTSGKTASTDKFLTYGPTSLGFALAPTGVAAGAPFGVAVTVLDNRGEVWTAPVQISLELDDASPANATLGGALTATSTLGVAVFTDLTVDQVAAGYRLRAFAGGLSNAVSEPFAATGSGPGPDPDPETAGHIFVNDSGEALGEGALRVFGVSADGELEEAAGSPYDTGNVAVSVARVGRFVYVANAGVIGSTNSSSLTGFEYDPADGSLAQVVQTATGSLGGNPNNLMRLVSGGGNLLIETGGLDGNIRAFRVDTANGSVTQADSETVGNNYIYGVHYVDVPSSTTDLLFVSTYYNVQAYLVDTATDTPADVLTSAGAPVDNLPGYSGTSRITSVGDQLFVANLLNPMNGAGLTQYTINLATGELTNPRTVLTPSPNGLSSSGNLLFVGNGNASSSVSVFQVVDDVATEVAGSPYPAGGNNPRSFAQVALSEGVAGLYVTTSTSLSAFVLDQATGALTSVDGSPYTGFQSAGDVTN